MEFARAFGSFWALLVVFGFFLFFVWPALVFFAVVRFLRDVRRMARALEALEQQGITRGPVAAPAPRAVAARGSEPIVPSMFGR